MKIKLDENLPVRLARALEKPGHDTDTIPEEGLAGRNDFLIWKAAQEAERFLITQDLFFFGYPSLYPRNPSWNCIGSPA